jgi:hypothetical protein
MDLILWKTFFGKTTNHNHNKSTKKVVPNNKVNKEERILNALAEQKLMNNSSKEACCTSDAFIKLSSSHYDNNDIGIMVNKAVNVILETEDNGKMCWTAVILAILVAFLAVHTFLVPLVLLTIDSSLQEPVRVNMVLFDEFVTPSLDDNKHTWEMTDSHLLSSIETTDFEVYLGSLVWVWVNLTAYSLEMFFIIVRLKDG